jgi:hypothetical protein
LGAKAFYKLKGQSHLVKAGPSIPHPQSVQFRK